MSIDLKARASPIEEPSSHYARWIVFSNEQLVSERNRQSNDGAKLAAVHILLDPNESLFQSWIQLRWWWAEKYILKLYPSIFKALPFGAGVFMWCIVILPCKISKAKILILLSSA